MSTEPGTGHQHLSETDDPRLDGIIYASAQANNRARNVVLFHKAARVAQIEIMEGAKLTVLSGSLEEEGGDYYYSVYEERFKKVQQQINSEALPGISFLDTPVQTKYTDDREMTLKVDLSAVIVHHVEAVIYQTKAFSVHRGIVNEDDIKF